MRLCLTSWKVTVTGRVDSVSAVVFSSLPTTLYKQLVTISKGSRLEVWMNLLSSVPSVFLEGLIECCALLVLFLAFTWGGGKPCIADIQPWMPAFSSREGEKKKISSAKTLDMWRLLLNPGGQSLYKILILPKRLRFEVFPVSFSLDAADYC